MTARTRIYPVFLPHAGCPFQCVYCNQDRVVSPNPAGSSQKELLGRGIEDMRALARQSRLSGMPGELAFYGGTFTSLPEQSLRRILCFALPLIREGIFSGIRFSTRPDSMTSSTCRILDEYPVQTVELGVQSMSREVLEKSLRGYGVDAVLESASTVKRHGWRLGIQMMAGLPGDSRGTFLDSIAQVVRLKPDFVRIYPTLVLSGTALAQWYRGGTYRPLKIEEALDWCAAAHQMLTAASIPVARMGLHGDPELEKPGGILAGPYHPAFGYLVKCRLWRNRVDELLQAVHPLDGLADLTIRVPARFISEAAGPGRSNIAWWQQKWGIEKIRLLQDATLEPLRFEPRLEPSPQFQPAACRNSMHERS